MILKSAFIGLLSFVALIQANVSPASLVKPEPGTFSQGKRGAAVSEQSQCSGVGVDIMKDGGNAADATIAMALCVGVIAAYHSGIGGGGFMLVRVPNAKGKGHTYEMIDFRETTPAAGNETMYVDNPDPTASTIGGLAVGVPGEMRGWELLHQRYGKLPWAKLFQPAINIARDGFIVGKSLAGKLNETAFPFLTADPLWAEVYAPYGRLLKEGDRCFRPRFADTLEKIANGGADVFYHGDIAANSAKAAQERGGILTTTDLANYTAILRTPAKITYRGYRIFSTIAPSSGSVVQIALKIFEGFPGGAENNDPTINVTTHRLIQSNKFGYGVRTLFGDPAFTANVSTLEAEFLTEKAAAAFRAKINDTHNFDAQYYDPENFIVLNDHGTSHMAAADGDDMVVSLTTTPGQVNSFGFPASPTNFIRPFKRPQSSIASTIIEDEKTGEFRLATGSAGGSRIITATLQNIYHVLDQKLTPQVALQQGRWHDQLSGTTTAEERRATQCLLSHPIQIPDLQLGLLGVDNRTVDFLANINYNMTFVSPLDLAEGHTLADAAISANGISPFIARGGEDSSKSSSVDVAKMNNYVQLIGALNYDLRLAPWDIDIFREMSLFTIPIPRGELVHPLFSWMIVALCTEN
ncbi:hypothetical protein Clacol_005351 [Clathrus columnatus]|uniref:Glutathione hydrolase n=1 Tax=Clathrus columnatus TaxID=1419009 RepID=A0AAV5ADY0_9AGAM|nr:hypothetical protein Clacol_005351 [Clathrus columnatus]